MQLNIMKKKTIKKWAEDINGQISIQKRHTKGQEAHEKMLNIASYQRNLNQNYDEMLPHISQQATTTKNPKTIYAEGGTEETEPSYTVGGM